MKSFADSLHSRFPAEGTVMEQKTDEKQQQRETNVGKSEEERNTKLGHEWEKFPYTFKYKSARREGNG